MAEKLKRFINDRREKFRDVAARLGLQVSGDIEHFFDLAQSGSLVELQAAFKALRQRRDSAAHPEDLRTAWTPIMETLGVAEAVHNWPAERLLEYVPLREPAVGSTPASGGAAAGRTGFAGCAGE